MALSLVVVLCLLATSAAAHLSDPVIQTNSGPVRGRLVSVSPTLQVYEFLGIPYAEPPTGENRFRKTVPKAPWQDTFDATKWPSACHHFSIMDPDMPILHEIIKPQADMSEDCLYLNLWVPPAALEKTKDANPFAAFTWIHGGAFSEGTTSVNLYNGSVLAAMNDIIVATVQYRLGSLGFAYDGTEQFPGNMGLWDQMESLKWICENLKSFGGTCDSHTIAGESAGGASVSYHLLSPYSRKYFKRAISESGTATTPWAMNFPELAKTVTGAVMEVQCPQAEDKVACLKETPAGTFPMADIQVMMKGFVLPFRPVIDGDFLPRHPLDLIASGDFYQAPLLIGANADEGSMVLRMGPEGKAILPVVPDESEMIKKLNFSHFSSLLMASIPVFFPVILSNPLVNKAIHLNYWPVVEDGAEEGPVVLRAAMDAVGDMSFTCPIFNWVKAASQFGSMGTQLYVYRFEHRRSDMQMPKWMGVYHAEEIAFVFGEPFMSHAAHVGHAEVDKEVSRLVMKLWSNFVKHGNPNANGDSDTCDAQTGTCSSHWPTYANAECQHTIARIGNAKLTAVCGIKARDCSFWGEFIPDLVTLGKK